jgi:periplasmic protein TonB
MLEASLIESAENPQRRKPWSVLLSTLAHVVLVALLLLVPLAQPQVLPVLSAAIGIPLPVVAVPQKPQPPPAAAPIVRTETVPTPGDLIAPASIPRDIANVVDDPAAAVRQIAAFHDAGVRDLIRPLVQPQPESAIPEPPPPPPAPAAPRGLTGPVRVSSMERANLLHQVAPEYPPLAKTAHVHGIVILEATISRTGDITEIRVISGHPLLIKAAVDAVQQWKYKPTFLSGEPVDVITTVTVNFALQ